MEKDNLWSKCHGSSSGYLSKSLEVILNDFVSLNIGALPMTLSKKIPAKVNSDSEASFSSQRVAHKAMQLREFDETKAQPLFNKTPAKSPQESYQRSKFTIVWLVQRSD